MWHSIKFTYTFQEVEPIEYAIDAFQKRYKLPVTEVRCAQADRGYIKGVLDRIGLKDIPIHVVLRETSYDEFATVWIGNNA